jgi:hypothetical protein
MQMKFTAQSGSAGVLIVLALVVGALVGGGGGMMFGRGRDGRGETPGVPVTPQ